MVFLSCRGKAELHNLESDNLVLTTQNEHSNDSVASLQMELSSFSNEVERIKHREVQQISELKSAHQAQTDGYEAEIYSLKREISALNVHVKDVEKSNFDLRSTANELNNDLQSLRMDSQINLDVASTGVTRQLQQSQAVNQELNQVLGVMQGDLKKSQREISNLLNRAKYVISLLTVVCLLSVMLMHV